MSRRTVEMINITMKNISTFGGLVSPYALSGLDTGKKAGIGAVDGKNAIGMLLFSYIEEPEKNICARLDWLFVLNAYRGYGIASQMLGIFFSTVKQLGVDRVVCQLGKNEPGHELGDFLEKQGFSKETAVSDDILIYQEQLINSPVIRRSIPDKMLNHIKRLEEMGGLERRRVFTFLNRLKITSFAIDDLNKHISAAYMDSESEISSAILVKMDSFGNIEPVIMRSLAKERRASAELAELIYFAMLTMLEENYAGTWIRIPMTEKKVENLMERLMATVPSRNVHVYSAGI